MADTGTGSSGCGDPVTGSRLGGYVIEAVLGRGAMGRVYRARQVSLDRPVALKVMISYLSQREDLVARFRREAMAAARLNHPNVVQVYDFVEAEGACFYVMELVDGLSLGDYLGRGERFSEQEVIEVGREVTMALEAVHEAGIIHRDVKPGNLMLTSKGVVKLADLGLARVHDLGTDVSLTLTGMNVGTPLYMAPEQAQGAKTVDHRADVYALGATLYHLATGRPPFEGETPGAILMKQVHEPPPDARALNASLGQAFCDLLRWMMAPRREDRPGTHGEILGALARCHTDVLRRKADGPSRIVSSTLAPPPEERGFPGGAKPWPMWAVCGGALATIAAVGWLATRPVEDSESARVSTAESAVRADGAVSTAKDTEAMKVGGMPPVPEAAVPTPRTTAIGASVTPAKPVETAPQAPPRTPSAPEAEIGTVVAVPTTPPVTPAASVPGKPIATPEELGSATKEKTFINSLRMKFVPIPGTKVLFCIWETRVRDFEAFVRESGYNWDQKPNFEQTPDHPVVMVSWNDAKAFCDWLSKKEGREYRLPTDEEWDGAAGREEFPWGSEWPPPEGTDNFAGQPDAPQDELIIRGYRDEHPRTAPVGSYKPLKNGLYDLSGNVREWVEDWYAEALYKKHVAGGGLEPRSDELPDIMKGNVRKVLRGGSWSDARRSYMRSSSRDHRPPNSRVSNFGFRCVLVMSSPFPTSTQTTPAKAALIEMSATAPPSGAQTPAPVASVAPPAAPKPTPSPAPSPQNLGPFSPDEAKELDAILAPLREAQASAQQAALDRIGRYVKELEELERKLAARADLDGVVKLRKEREVWTGGQRTPKPDASARMPAEYNNLRYFLDRDLGLIDSRVDAALDRQSPKAALGLKAFEAKLTRATRLEAALAVREISAKIEESKVREVGAGDAIRSATEDRPFVNSLGMKFVPIPGTKVLFCIWETRVKDFEAFVKASAYYWHAKPTFEQGPDHPVVLVSWDDAKAFCDWLGKKEGRQYRLPTDDEWDVVVSKDPFPWGKEWPPPKGMGNFAGEESKPGRPDDPKEGSTISGYRDEHPRTAPVGSYKPLKNGLHDLSGNVWECCEDWYTEALSKKSRDGGGGQPSREVMGEIRRGDVRKVFRGGSWRDCFNWVLRSSNRLDQPPDSRSDLRGFRCVLVLP